jgi:hypothetical protein
MRAKDRLESADSKLRALAERIKREHPKADREEFLKIWKAEINADKELQEALLTRTFHDHMERLKREEPDLYFGRPDTEH